jgi:CRP-like cAMP-binding protein
MPPSSSPKQNLILAGLPSTDYARLLPDLEQVCIPMGERIYQPDVRITYLYFPIDCIIAGLNVLQNGAAIRTSVTGNEGMIGLSSILGYERTCVRVVALTGGEAFRIRTPLIRKEFNSGRALRHVLLRFTHAMIMQMGHIAVGSRDHTIVQQLCHLLLMILDRLSGNELQITHKQLSGFLGANRESITLAIQKLERTGAIQHRRGHMTILNRQELEDRVGQSYAMVTNEYRRLHLSLAFEQANPTLVG